MAVHRHAPRDCPVCGDALALTRLSCDTCGTELSGAFEACEFCTLSRDEREVLRVFLASRGNMKQLERHVGVSYPMARARLDVLFGKLGLARPSDTAGPRLEVLDELARGEIYVEEALKRL